MQDVIQLRALENKINEDIGYYYSKKYIAATFWSQISMPINLCITLLTALTTGQAATETLLSNLTFINISVATLILSVLNTFFRPNIQMNRNIELMKKWQKIGNDFEIVYYSPDKYKTFKESVEKYINLQKEINQQKQSEGADTVNFLTDLFHMIALCTCLRKKRKQWISTIEDTTPITVEVHTTSDEVNPNS
jgi:hypothetical protein